MKDQIKFIKLNKRLDFISYIFLVIGFIGMVACFVICPAELGNLDHGTLRMILATSVLVLCIIIYIIIQAIIQRRIKKLTRIFNK